MNTLSHVYFADAFSDVDKTPNLAKLSSISNVRFTTKILTILLFKLSYFLLFFCTPRKGVNLQVI